MKSIFCVLFGIVCLFACIIPCIDLFAYINTSKSVFFLPGIRNWFIDIIIFPSSMFNAIYWLHKGIMLSKE